MYIYTHCYMHIHSLLHSTPKLWVHYVDDTFVIWQHGLDKLELFQQHLNNIRKSIKFTMEAERGQLPFLDVMVKTDDNHLTASISEREPTPTVTSITTRITTPTQRQM